MNALYAYWEEQWDHKKNVRQTYLGLRICFVNGLFGNLFIQDIVSPFYKLGTIMTISSMVNIK